MNCPYTQSFYHHMSTQFPLRPLSNSSASVIMATIMSNPFEIYLAKIQTDLRGGKATEHTYRSALETLLEALAPNIVASNDPKHISAGAPDFIVERGHVPLGYVETKEVGKNLDEIETSEQLKRYRQSLNNLVLTDYLEFRWYVQGKHRLTTRAATLGKNKKLYIDADGVQATRELLQQFYATQTPTVGTPKELAQRMAALTRITHDLILGALENENDDGVFHKQLRTFREYLIPGLSQQEFADIYAQTMAYGLFAARVNLPANKTFSRAEASLYLPQANPFLRKLFRDVGEELDGTPVAPFLDDLAELLNRADMHAILEDFGKRTRTEDPVVHFYETFLAEYDPKLREARGVYYTPEPVVQFIVHSVDEILRTRFQRASGLADPNALILDPATGTATFLYYVIRRIHEIQTARGQQGAWENYVHEKLLPRLFGFELLMAPYSIAHLKLGLLLNELGYAFQHRERLGVFLTNTLEEAVTHAETLGLSGYLSEEGNQAAEVKNQEPIMIVLGNPPYSGHSANKGDWISGLVRDYYFVDGKPLGERNPKWLQDDYVKFIRFAQWRIQRTGYGIVAMITNHGYLDNPTFRGMRQNLLQTFDEIFVLDLHGNAKKREVAPDGGKDENVFDIQQGVAILLGIKSPSPVLGEGRGEGLGEVARVYHADLWGKRQAKYETLARATMGTMQWQELQISAPHYLFVPLNEDLKSEYEQGWKLNGVMPINSVGVVTGQDANTIAFEKNEAQALAAKLKIRPHFVKPVLYRPFDIRYIVYDSKVVTRNRFDVMRHLISEKNLGIVYMRQVALQDDYTHFGVTEFIVDNRSFYSNKGIMSVAPLYLYTTPAQTAGTLFAQTETTRAANLSPQFINAFAEKLQLEFVGDGKGNITQPPSPSQGEGRGEGQTFGPEDIFHYIYAIFHSPAYRARYAEFLKIDFPRVPLTSDKKLFASLVALGAKLVDLHLLRAPELDNYISTFPITGTNIVDKVTYKLPSPDRRGDDASSRTRDSMGNMRDDASGGEVSINAAQYFGNVPERVWSFRIGGYQVAEKWLKDRKGRKLSGDDIAHYQRVLVALNETIALMENIDAVIGEFPLQ